jgi:hypothetical protein
MSGEGEPKVVNLFTRKPVAQPAETAGPAELVPTTPGHELGAVPSEVDADLGFYHKNRSRIMQTVALAERMERTIDTLPGYTRKERTIALRAEMVRGSSLEGLFSSLTQSSEADWKSKPSYYLALIYELSGRLEKIAARVLAEKVAAGKGSAESTGQEALMADVLFAITHSERAIAACQHIDVITDYIFAMPGFTPNQANISLRRQGLAFHTLQQLCGFILDSNEFQWRKDPSFYGAVILELDLRTKAVKPVLRQEEAGK